jgi:uncharacterized protein DUF6745
MGYSGRLTVGQYAGTIALRDEWVRAALSTEPCDRPAAEAAVRRAHRAAGLAPPRVVVWMDSPLGGTLAGLVLRHRTEPPTRRWAGMWDRMWAQLGQRLGADRRDRLTDQLWRQLDDAVWARLPPELRVPADRLLRPPLADVDARVAAHLDGAAALRLVQDLAALLAEPLQNGVVSELGDRPTFDLWDREHDVLGERLRALRDGPAFPWEHGNPLSVWSLAYPLVLRTRALEIAGLPPSDRLAAVSAAVRAVGSWWPARGVAVLTERPVALHRDPQGRLHRADGPAVAYADGYALHAWHGTRVPADLVAGAGWGTRRILAERNSEVRRCAIERLGWDRFAADAGLRQVGADRPDPGNPGQVLRLFELPTGLRDLYHQPARILVVANASPDRDGRRRSFGLPVPADVPDALSAAAATFGLDPAEYADLARAT